VRTRRTKSPTKMASIRLHKRAARTDHKATDFERGQPVQLMDNLAINAPVGALGIVVAAGGSRKLVEVNFGALTQFCLPEQLEFDTSLISLEEAMEKEAAADYEDFSFAKGSYGVFGIVHNEFEEADTSSAAYFNTFEDAYAQAMEWARSEADVDGRWEAEIWKEDGDYGASGEPELVIADGGALVGGRRQDALMREQGLIPFSEAIEKEAAREVHPGDVVSFPPGWYMGEPETPEESARIPEGTPFTLQRIVGTDWHMTDAWGTTWATSGWVVTDHSSPFDMEGLIPFEEAIEKEAAKEWKVGDRILFMNVPRFTSLNRWSDKPPHWHPGAHPAAGVYTLVDSVIEHGAVTGWKVEDTEGRYWYASGMMLYATDASDLIPFAEALEQ
jgi:hypothetical protein